MNEVAKEQLQRDAIFYVGRVSGVRGRKITVAVDQLKNTSHLIYQGALVRNIAVGSYIKIVKGFNELIGRVEGEYITENPITEREYTRKEDPLFREVEVSLVGFIDEDTGRFERGLREMPLIDNECFVLTHDEFQSIHAVPNPDDETIQIGSLAVEPDQAIEVSIDSLFASHTGIFGNTGSGKSYTLAKIYHELFTKYLGKSDKNGEAKGSGFRDSAQFIILDFSGEYISVPQPADHPEPGWASSVIADGDWKREFKLGHGNKPENQLPVPGEAFSDLEFWTVVLDATEKTQAPFLRRVLDDTYWRGRLESNEKLSCLIADLVARGLKSSDNTIDRLTAINLLDGIKMFIEEDDIPELEKIITCFHGRLGWHSANRKMFYRMKNGNSVFADDLKFESLTSEKIRDLKFSAREDLSPIDEFHLRVLLKYYSDIFSGFSNKEHLAPLIKRLEARAPELKQIICRETDENNLHNPLNIISLRDVSIAMRKVIPLFICKYLYTGQKLGNNPKVKYLNLIIDEAHNILSYDSSRESEQWRDHRLETFEEIIKEGRKFGVFLTIASQRPQDISPTITSQLHNYFLHRLVNHRDIKAIENAVSYLDQTSFESLPILSTGTCIMAGIATRVPAMVKIDPIEERFAPNSRTTPLTKGWREPEGKNVSTEREAEGGPDEEKGCSYDNSSLSGEAQPVIEESQSDDDFPPEEDLPF